jgi:biuret amidohydrolase
VRHPAPRGAPPGRWAGPSAHHEIDAGGIDGFFQSPLDRLLRGSARDHIVLGGFGLEGPVHSTLRSANDRGYECLLLADASASLNVTLAHSALSMICMSGGIFGAVGETPELLRALDRTTTPREDQ